MKQFKVKDFINAKDASEMLGVSRQAIKNWAEAGSIRHYVHPVNKRKLYLKQDIQDLVDKLNKVVAEMDKHKADCKKHQD